MGPVESVSFARGHTGWDRENVDHVGQKLHSGSRGMVIAPAGVSLPRMRRADDFSDVLKECRL